MSSILTGKRGRPRKINPNKKVEPLLTLKQYNCLMRLVELGYAPSVAQVAAYLITREIDDLKRTGVLQAGDDEHKGAAQDDHVPPSK